MSCNMIDLFNTHVSAEHHELKLMRGLTTSWSQTHELRWTEQVINKMSHIQVVAVLQFKTLSIDQTRCFPMSAVPISPTEKGTRDAPKWILQDVARHRKPEPNTMEMFN